MAKNGQKGRKLGRMKDWCKTYKLRGTEDANRKRKMLRHLKHNPGDETNMAVYTKLFGEPKGLQLTYKGRRLQRLLGASLIRRVAKGV